MNTSAKQTLDDILSGLKAKLAEPGHSLIPTLTAMSRFPQYSLSNQLLILAQRTDATRVMGYRAWNKAGFQVRKGEKGIMIYAPLCVRDDRDADADTGTTECASTRLLYRVAYVFDVSQVERLADGAAEPVVLETATAEPLRALEQLKAFLLGHNLELRYEALRDGLYGYTDGRCITCAAGLDAPIEFSTLVHEATHALLHFPADGSPRPDLTTRETEAEAVAFILCEQLAIPGHAISVDYIRAYRGTPETLDTSLARIRTTAARLGAELAAVSFEPPEIPA